MNIVVNTKIAPKVSANDKLIDGFCAIVAESVFTIIRDHNPEWLAYERHEALVHSVILEYISEPIKEKIGTPEGKTLIGHIKKIEATIQKNNRLSPDKNPMDRQLLVESVAITLKTLKIRPPRLTPPKGNR